MKWSLAVLSLVLSTSGNALINKDIRVRVVKQASKMVLKAQDGRLEYESKSFRFASAEVRLDNSKFIVLMDGEWNALVAKKLRIHARDLEIDKTDAATDLILEINGDGRLDVIAALPVEQYLKSVLPAEMPLSWPMEALRAQTVAARSFAYRRMIEREGYEWDVEADVTDQKFRAGAINPKVESLVESTRGLVLLNSQSHILRAFYHADCGGVTEDAHNVWGGNIEIPSAFVTRPDCPHPSPSWDVSFDRATVISKLKQYFRFKNSIELQSLQSVGRTPTGRVRGIRVNFSELGIRQISSQEFRRIMGFEKLPSTNFRLSWIGKTLKVAGLGRGHGVGLCQLGARTLAEKGSSYKEILQFYYPNTRLTYALKLM
jgi:stage II sporulation protein D